MNLQTHFRGVKWNREQLMRQTLVSCGVWRYKCAHTSATQPEIPPVIIMTGKGNSVLIARGWEMDDCSKQTVD